MKEKNKLEVSSALSSASAAAQTIASSSASAVGGSGFAVVAFVLGAVAFFIGLIPFLGALPGILAVILGIIGLKGEWKGMAVAGIILGSLALLGVVLWATIIVIGANLPHPVF